MHEGTSASTGQKKGEENIFSFHTNIIVALILLSSFG